MTEAEWLASADPTPMLYFIKQRRTMRQPTKQRKQRLFAVACCRLLWPLIPDDGQRCVEVAEGFADNQATGEELDEAEAKANAIWLEDASDGARFACMALCSQKVDGLMVSGMTFNSVSQRGQDVVLSQARQCGLILDIFGNPFRPVSITPSWLTSTVAALAEGIYQERAFDRLPILADALMDAGCDNTDVLTHCRSEGPHVRGCWVVDLLTGRA